MVLKDIMNSIVTDMKFTVETQYDYENHLLPTLDFAMRLSESNSDGSRSIYYEFYKSP